jgi:hypothetical protein
MNNGINPKFNNYLNVTQYASGGWLDKYDDSNQFAEGGEIDPPTKNKPIYVQSKNDPRYQEYQDSLMIHNATKDYYKHIKESSGKNLTKNQKKKLIDEFFKADHDIYNYQKSNDYFNKKGDWTIGKDIEPIRRGVLKLHGDNYRVGNNNAEELSFSYYKKPEQQVIIKDKTNTSSGYKSESQYKKEHPPIYVTDKNDPRINTYTEEGSQYLYRPVEKKPIRAIKNNLRPEGLVTRNTDLYSELPTIRPTAKNAKSYKVKETVQGMYAPSTVEYEVTDPRNINMNDLGPDNTRTVIPQYKYGGQIDPPGKKKLQFLQPTSNKLPEGYKIPYNTPSSELAMSIGGEDGEPAYLIPSFKYGKSLDDPMGEFRKTGEHLGGPFKTWQEADEWERTVRHPAVEKKQTIMFPQEKFQMGGHLNQKQSSTNSWLNKYE